MPYDVGDVVLVPFSFTDQTASKRRPALVVSGRPYNAAEPDVVLMPVTSQLRAAELDVPVADCQSAGSLKPSAVKTGAGQLGHFAATDRTALRNAICKILDLQQP